MADANFTAKINSPNQLLEGASDAEISLYELLEKIELSSEESFDNDSWQELFSSKRNEMILDVVNKLGDLSDYQKGFIYTLIDFSQHCLVDPVNRYWHASLNSNSQHVDATEKSEANHV